MRNRRCASFHNSTLFHHTSSPQPDYHPYHERTTVVQGSRSYHIPLFKFKAYKKKRYSARIYQHQKVPSHFMCKFQSFNDTSSLHGSKIEIHPREFEAIGLTFMLQMRCFVEFFKLCPTEWRLIITGGSDFREICWPRARHRKRRTTFSICGAIGQPLRWDRHQVLSASNGTTTRVVFRVFVYLKSVVPQKQLQGANVMDLHRESIKKSSQKRKPTAICWSSMMRFLGSVPRQLAASSRQLKYTPERAVMSGK